MFNCSTKYWIIILFKVIVIYIERKCKLILFFIFFLIFLRFLENFLGFQNGARVHIQKKFFFRETRRVNGVFQEDDIIVNIQLTTIRRLNDNFEITLNLPVNRNSRYFSRTFILHDDGQTYDYVHDYVYKNPSVCYKKYDLLSQPKGSQDFF